MKTLSKSENAETLEAVFSDDTLVDSLARKAVQDALLEHKRKGQSVVIWQDGKVVTLAPEDIPVDISESE